MSGITSEQVEAAIAEKQAAYDSAVSALEAANKRHENALAAQTDAASDLATKQQAAEDAASALETAKTFKSELEATLSQLDIANLTEYEIAALRDSTLKAWQDAQAKTATATENLQSATDAATAAHTKANAAAKAYEDATKAREEAEAKLEDAKAASDAYAAATSGTITAEEAARLVRERDEAKDALDAAEACVRDAEEALAAAQEALDEELSPKDIASAEVSGVSGWTYDGRAHALAPVVTLSGRELRAGTDYRVASGGTATAAGRYELVIEGIAPYKGARRVGYTVARAAVAVPKATSRTYTGKAQVGVAAGAGYKLAGTARATNVGTYAATATPDANHRWPDGGTGAKRLKWKINPASLAKASVAKVANQAYTGKAVKPRPAVRLGGRTLKLNRDYTLSYKNNVKAGTATITVRGKGNYKGTKSVRFKIVAPSVTYRTHVQSYGNQAWKKNGQPSGTFGQSKRLEGIWIKVGGKPVKGSIQYRTHVQTFGWQGWKSEGQMSGTSGLSKRLEAIQIRLSGNMAKRYDVYYRVHAQQLGWMGWAKNGAQAGTAGYSYRLEAIQVVLLPKGSKAPGGNYQGQKQTTAQPFRQK